MYVRGILAKGQPVESLWSTTKGAPFFLETMSRYRFKKSMKFLRFDIRSTRSTRFQTGEFTMVSKVWDRFVASSIAYHTNDNITI